MITRALLPLSFLFILLTACGDNIHPESDSTGDGDGECFDERCPSDVDQPDAGTGTPTPDGGGTGDPDGGTGGGTDGGTGGGSDGGTGGGSDGGTGGGTDGGTPECTVDTDCSEGETCVDGACVCDHHDDHHDGGCAPDEVYLCHVPPGNPEGSHGICVGAAAAQAHLGHGDTLGACQ